MVAFALAGISLCAQAPSDEKVAKPKLTMTTIGHGKTNRNLVLGFRIYEVPDGGQGLIEYTNAGSTVEAMEQFEDWKTAIETVSSLGYGTTNEAQDGNDRVSGTAANADHQTLYIIVRRAGQRCYRIKSIRPDVALLIEDMIKP